MGDKKKICLVIPSLKIGGMERVMSEFANYLSLNNYQIFFILLTQYDPVFNLEKNIKIIKPYKSFPKNIFGFIRLIIYFRKNIIKMQPDTILSFGERYNSYLLLSLIGLKFPVFISDRSSPIKKLDNLHKILRKLLYPKAHGIISQTRIAETILRKVLSNDCPKIKVIPNPVRKITIYNELIKKNIILAVGRLTKEKRYDRLLEIAQKFEKQDWQFYIVGGGPLYTVLSKEIKNKNLTNKVKLIGEVKNIDYYFSLAKIFILTSDSEGFPNSLCEAMAHGLACICFNCIAGPSDIIKHNINGYLIEDGNIEEFLKYLHILVNNENLRINLGVNAKQINNLLNSEIIFNEYEKFIIK